MLSTGFDTRWQLAAGADSAARHSDTLTPVRSSDLPSLPGRWRRAFPPVRRSIGEWLSLVEHLVRDQGVGGSNPLSPTTHSILPLEDQNGRCWRCGAVSAETTRP